MKKKLLVVVSTTLCLAFSSFPVLANVGDSAYDIAVTTPISTHLTESSNDDNILSDLKKGSSKPNSKKVHDLSDSTYNYTVSSIGARVYTNTWFTGTTKICVNVDNWERLTGSDQAESYSLTVSLYNSKSRVAINTLAMGSGSNTVSFTNLEATGKYYVLFSVPTNGNRYSFDGSISN